MTDDAGAAAAAAAAEHEHQQCMTRSNVEAQVSMDSNMQRQVARLQAVIQQASEAAYTPVANAPTTNVLGQWCIAFPHAGVRQKDGYSTRSINNWTHSRKQRTWWSAA
jgi:hypothetical protein